MHGFYLATCSPTQPYRLQQKCAGVLFLWAFELHSNGNFRGAAFASFHLTPIILADKTKLKIRKTICGSQHVWC